MRLDSKTPDPVFPPADGNWYTVEKQKYVMVGQNNTASEPVLPPDDGNWYICNDGKTWQKYSGKEDSECLA